MARLTFIVLLALGLAGVTGVAGAQSDQVLHVQKRLEELGFDPGPIDGLMEPRTREAIRDFQEQAVLPATGELDPRTLAALVPPSVEDTDSPQEPPSRPSPRAPISEVRHVDRPRDSTNPESRDEIRTTVAPTKEASQHPVPSSDGGTKGVPLKGNSGFEGDTPSAGTRVVAGPATSDSFRNRELVKYLRRVPEWLWWTACIGSLFLLWKALRRRTKEPVARPRRETASLREGRSTRGQVHSETSFACSGPPGVRSAPPHRTATASPPPTPERISPSVWLARTARPRSSGASRKLRWIPAGESVTVAGRNIGGMVYVGPEMASGRMDNGFIDPSKPVAGKADDLQVTGMPYGCRSRIDTKKVS